VGSVWRAQLNRIVDGANGLGKPQQAKQDWERGGIGIMEISRIKPILLLEQRILGRVRDGGGFAVEQ